MQDEFRRNAWLRCFQSRSAPSASMICFPPAGAGATFFRTWGQWVPPDVEVLAVQYPGRQDRYHESSAADLHEVADEIAAAARPCASRVAVLFGHSLGAAIAYEVAVRLEIVAPRLQLAVSGRVSPRDEAGGRLHAGDAQSLWEDVRRLQGVDAEVLDSRELRHVLLPALRSDYRLSETYRPRPTTRISTPVAAFVGTSDPDVSVAQAARWADVTTGRFELLTFPGNHFYLVANEPEVVGALVRWLAAPSGAGKGRRFSTCPST